MLLTEKLCFQYVINMKTFFQHVIDTMVLTRLGVGSGRVQKGHL